jgi:hypothetical protein
LKLRLLHSQERKYEKELAALDYTKQLDFSHLTLDGSGIKSVPISGRMHRNKVMKRKKRERVEEKCDLASHMSNHTLFSYYGMPFPYICLFFIFLLFLFIIFCLSLLLFSREIKL